jgi:hypothetical protein
MAQDPNQPPQTGAVATGTKPPPSGPSQYDPAGVSPSAAGVFGPYNALQNGYLGPLQGATQPAMPNFNDPTLQSIAERLAALQQSHPVISGKQPPSVDSIIAKQTSHLSAAQIAGEVGKETWQQSIVQPLTDFINVWKTDPKAGLLETLGGAALVGGLIGLEAVTGGAATPFIFAAMAALVAPGMIQSWGDELHNPTDSNLVRALVSTSTGLIAVGTPIRWAKGMQMGRNALSFALREKRNMVSAEDALPAILSGHPEWRNKLSMYIRPEEQLATLHDRPNQIRVQFEELGVPLQDKNVSEFLNRSGALEGLRKAYVATTDPAKRQELKQRMLDYAKKEVLPLRIGVASHYLFLLDSRIKHIPLGPTEKTALLDANIQTKAANEMGQIMGYLRGIGGGHPGLHSDQLSSASLVEHVGRDTAAGGSGFLIAKMHFHHDELVKHLGIGEEDMQKVEIAMEDPKAWEKLTAKQELYGQYRSMMHGAMSMAELRWGTIPNAIAGYLPRMFTGAEEVPHTQGVKDILAGLHGSMQSRSRVYQAAFDSMNGDISYVDRTRAQILADEENISGIFKAQQPLRDYLSANEATVTASRETASGFKRWVSIYRNKAGKAKTPEEAAKWEAKAVAEETTLERHYDVENAKHIRHGTLVSMPADAYEKLKRVAPLQRKLLTGSDLFKASTASFVYRMEEASLRAAAETHANMSITELKDLFLKMPLGKYGIALQHPSFRSEHPLPDFMPSSAFASGKDATKGYKEVFRAIGRPGDLHYRPSVLARDDLADELHKIMEGATTGSEVFSGMSGALYKTVHVSKRFIMASPFWHAMNVGGRLIAFAMEDPVGAKTALSTVWGKGEFLLSHEERAALETRASQAGLKHANHFEVTNQQHRMMKNQDGQSTWPTALRTLTGPVSHAYQDMLEGGFWKMVDDFQLAAFQLAEHKMRVKLPHEPEAEISRLAAEYANNLAGMVNPLYMNKTYRHMRNLIWFAPSYWATFMRTLISLPGADRMSNFLAHYHGGDFVRFGNVPLKAVSEAGRRELTRMQRSWLTTYLATSVVAADMLNVMLGGRHLWENDPGHMFDVNVDNFAAWSHQLPVVGGLSPGGPQTQASGGIRHTYISAVPFFRQGADVMNGLGLGHDWGLAHQFGDSTWQQAGLMQKAMMAAGATADGLRREAANKLSGVPQAAYGVATGEQLSPRLGQGVQRKVKGPIGNLDAILALVPGGMTLERFFGQEAGLADKYPVGSPEYIKAQQQAMESAKQAIPSALIQQFTGFPSMYHVGPEQAPVDDDKMKNWYGQRNTLHDALQNASKQMFAGQMTPLGYERKRQQLLDRLIQLDSDTFGRSSPAAPLASVRSQLAQQLGLDNLGLSDSEWYARYQNFQSAWDQILESASPLSRAAWWEAQHSQWTDADYLVWEAQELKKSIAAAVDGQGGAHIRAYENQVASLQSLPLTTAERLKIEQADPYYYTYRQVLTAMSRSSALGAFINAFTSPFSETFILPSGLTPDEQQQMASLAPSSASLITPETAAELAAKAKTLANDSSVAAAGGKATGSPEFNQELEQMAQDASNG